MNGCQESLMCEDVPTVSPIISTGLKRCGKCEMVKRVSDFHKNKSKPDGLCTECKKCHCKAVRAYNKNNKEKIGKSHKTYASKHKKHIAEYHKKWTVNNNDKIRGYTKKRSKAKSEYDKNRWKNLSKEDQNKEMKVGYLLRDNFTNNNPELIIYRTAKKRAQKNNVEFNIELKDIKIPEICPIFGTKLNMTVYKKGDDIKLKDSRPSIDRIDNTKGYTKGNIAIISLRANRIKSDSTPEEIALLAKWIGEN